MLFGVAAVAQGQTKGAGYSLHLDSLGTYIKLPKEAFTNTGSITIEMWVNFREAPQNKNILYIGDAGGNFFTFQTDNTSLCPCCKVGLNGSIGPGGSNSVGTGTFNTLCGSSFEWRHIAFTFDSASTSTNIYNNGRNVASNFFFTKNMRAINRNTAFFYIGTNAAVNRNSNMYVDEIRVYNRALTETELLTNMSNYLKPINPVYSNLMAYFKCDEGSGDTLRDSKNGLKATLINTPVWQNSTAPIGDTSVFRKNVVYGDTLKMATDSAGTFMMTLQNSGTTAGIFNIHFINGKPENTSMPPGVATYTRMGYFGAKMYHRSTNATTYSVIYDYTKHRYINREGELGMVFRDDALSPWASATVTYDTILNRIKAVGFVGTQFLLTSSSALNPLPLVFTDFRGKINGDYVTLNWATDKESNCERYEVQMLSKENNWEPISTISAANSYKYQASFYKPEGNKGAFRIAAIGKTSVTYSKAILLQYIASQDVSIFPNPSAGNFSIVNTAESDFVYQILNTQGQVIHNGNVKGNNTFVVSGLTTGIYFLKATNGEYRKIVVQ